MENLTHHRLYRDHEFDTAFSELYGIYKRNFWPLFLLSLAGTLILHLLFYYVGMQHMDFSGIAAEAFEPSRGFVTNMLIMMLDGLLIYTFLNLAITWFVFRRQVNLDEPAFSIFGQAAGKYYFRFLLLLILVSLILNGIVRVLVLPLAPIFAVILYYKLKHQEDALPGIR